jgi:hypothetical protein
VRGHARLIIAPLLFSNAACVLGPQPVFAHHVREAQYAPSRTWWAKTGWGPRTHATLEKRRGAMRRAWPRTAPD